MSGGIPPASPAPEQVKKMRRLAGQTQTEAARSVYATLRAWQGWEAPEGAGGARKMPAAVWELYLLACRKDGIQAPPPLAAHLKKRWGE